MMAHAFTANGDPPAAAQRHSVNRGCAIAPSKRFTLVEWLVRERAAFRPPGEHGRSFMRRPSSETTPAK